MDNVVLPVGVKNENKIINASFSVSTFVRWQMLQLLMMRKVLDL